MILVLRALGVGDLATGVPALRGLRKAFGDEPLVLAAPRWLAPLAALTGAVSELVPLDSLDGELHVPSPEVAVNLHGRGPQSHALLRRLEPGRLLAFGDGRLPDFGDGRLPDFGDGRLPGFGGGRLPGFGGGRLPDFGDGRLPGFGHGRLPGFGGGPVWIDEEHEVVRWCRMLSWYGIDADPDDLDLDLPAGYDGPRGVTVVHPGAKSGRRRWPVERYAEVARALTAAGHRVHVTGSPAEEPLARAVADLSGLPGEAVLAGRTDLRDLAGVIGHASLVISGDTGVAHLAGAYRVPSVTLFGPMSPARWGPPARPRHRTIWHGTTVEAGDVPGDEPHPALAAVTVAEVLAAAGL